MIKFLKSTYRRIELKAKIGSAKKINIVVGAGRIPYKGWLLTEVDYLNLLIVEDWKDYFANHPIDAILAEHVWEHLTAEQGRIAAKNCFDYLKPGGYLRIAVPDGGTPDPTYIEAVRPGGTGAGADDHKVLYTAESLTKMLSDVGFDVKPLEWYDAKGQFHFSEWDPADGMVQRSKRFDERNANGQLKYTSLILDAVKK